MGYKDVHKNQPQELEPAYLPDEQYNFRAMFLDGVFFMWGSTFADSATVLPVFVSTLISSSVLIGLVAAIRTGGWFLPQLFVARIASRLSRKLKVSVIGMAIHRSSFYLMAASVLLFAGRRPELALALFFFFLVTLSLGDGITGVPYVDIVGKSISHRRRGRLFGYYQAMGGLLAFGSGFIIRYLLGPQGPAYPVNYAVVLFTGAVIATGSFIAFSLVKEPPGQPATVQVGLWDYLRAVPRYWREHPVFARLVTARLLANSVWLSIPFFAVFARDQLGVPAGTVGLYVSAQMVGSVLGSLALGHAGDRLGNRAVVRATAAVVSGAPLAGLVAAGAMAAGVPQVAAVVMFMPFMFSGVYAAAGWIGFTNYLIEVVPAELRPMYTGIMNTVMAVTSFLPVAGGLLVQLAGYQLTFLLTLVTTGLGFWVASNMPEPRVRQAPNVKPG